MEILVDRHDLEERPGPHDLVDLPVHRPAREATRLWVVVSADGEQFWLQRRIDDYLAALAFEDQLVIVTDGPRERWSGVLRRASRDLRVHVVNRSGWHWPGDAVIAGCRYVASNGWPEDVVCVADDSVNGQMIARFCAEVPDNELLVASRSVGSDGMIHHRSGDVATLGRRVRRLLGLDLADPEGVMKAMRVSQLMAAIDRVDVPGPAAGIDLVLAAQEAGIVVREVPFSWPDSLARSRVPAQGTGPGLPELMELRRKYGAVALADIIDLREHRNRRDHGAAAGDWAGVEEPAGDGAGAEDPSGDLADVEDLSSASAGVEDSSTDLAGVEDSSSAWAGVEDSSSALAGVEDSSSAWAEDPEDELAGAEYLSGDRAGAEEPAGDRAGAEDPSGDWAEDLSSALAGAEDLSSALAGSEDPAADESRRQLRQPPTVLSRLQKCVFVIGLLGVAAALATWTVATVVLINAALVVFFILANAMKLALVHRSLNHPCAVTIDLREPIPDDELPVYTILLPVYREASVLQQLVSGIEQLDYPMDRLDVKLLLEASDTETQEAARATDLPACVDVLIVPDIGPTGKPRACNHGLSKARGEFLVIYDAEDRPEPDQLRKAVAGFRDADPEVVCLQAKLNYFNRAHNLLTRWFTSEYSVWFDQLLPGLQSLDVAIPLGGTSNHFPTERLRELGGWNEYNVTEDADLGLRIFLQGWKTAILDTTTYEEATSRYGNWVRQRSRWVKGYMQTYLFHMRHPVRLARQMGLKAFAVFQLFFGASTVCLLLNPIYWLLTLLWFAAHLHVIQLAFPRPVLYAGTLGLFLGNAACVLSAVSGCVGRRDYEDVKWAFLVPFYWVLMSVAAGKALIQLVYRPSYWEKTEHGFCTYEGSAVKTRVAATTTVVPTARVAAIGAVGPPRRRLAPVQRPVLQG